MALSRILKTAGKVAKSVIRDYKASIEQGVYFGEKKSLKNHLGAIRHAVENNSWKIKRSIDNGFYGHSGVSGHKTDSFYSNVSNPIGKGKC